MVGRYIFKFFYVFGNLDDLKVMNLSFFLNLKNGDNIYFIRIIGFL